MLIKILDWCDGWLWQTSDCGTISFAQVIGAVVKGAKHSDRATDLANPTWRWHGSSLEASDMWLVSSARAIWRCEL